MWSRSYARKKRGGLGTAAKIEFNDVVLNQQIDEKIFQGMRGAITIGSAGIVLS